MVSMDKSADTWKDTRKERNTAGLATRSFRTVRALAGEGWRYGVKLKLLQTFQTLLRLKRDFALEFVLIVNDCGS